MRGARAPRARWKRFGGWALLAVLYIVTARLGLMLAFPPALKATAVWPPSGIALSAVLLLGTRVWPGIWLGAFLANLLDVFAPSDLYTFSQHLLVSAAIATGSTWQPIAAARLLHWSFGDQNPIRSSRGVVHLVTASFLSCLIASTIGVTSLCVAGMAAWTSFAFDWWTWWVGDSIGICVVTPLALAWCVRSPREERAPGAVEALLLLSLIAGVGVAVFGKWDLLQARLDFGYVAIPPLVWAVYRFGQRGATASLVLLAGIAVWGTAEGHGPFVRGTLNESLLALQVFVGVVAVMSLALGAVLAERRETERAQTALLEHHRQVLAEIKILRGLIPICAWCKKIRGDEGLWQQVEMYVATHSEASFSHSICPDCTALQRLTIAGRGEA